MDFKTDNDVYEVFQRWDRVKRAFTRMKQEEDEIKTQIHLLMNERQTNFIDINDMYCHRSIQERQTVSKKKTPISVWNRYVHTTVFPTLTLRNK